MLWTFLIILSSGTDGTIVNLCFHSPLSIRIAGSFQGHAYLAVRVGNQMIQETSCGEDEGTILYFLPILYLIIQGTLDFGKKKFHLIMPCVFSQFFYNVYTCYKFPNSAKCCVRQYFIRCLFKKTQTSFPSSQLSLSTLFGIL